MLSWSQPQRPNGAAANSQGREPLDVSGSRIEQPQRGGSAVSNRRKRPPFQAFQGFANDVAMILAGLGKPTASHRRA
jgi:hypothetical protein